MFGKNCLCCFMTGLHAWLRLFLPYDSTTVWDIQVNLQDTPLLCLFLVSYTGEIKGMMSYHYEVEYNECHDIW